ncbi:MAG: hypothetical protein J0651_04775, partial [Actinobacteria bacterium]|nr:hypothetical protein [Actinomycetota bacterium]
NREFVQSRPMQVPPTSSAVLVRNDQVFFTGAETYRRAFLYDFTLNSTKEYPSTLTRRTYHGSACIHGTVYLFGGDRGLGNTGEKCFLSKEEWTWLPSMPTRRSGFTPCVRQMSVFLCGGNTALSHVFHIDTELYEELPFTLPVATWCVAIWVLQDLVIENRQYRVKWNKTEGVKRYAGGRATAV